MRKQPSPPRSAFVCKGQKCFWLVTVLFGGAASAYGAGNDPPGVQAVVRSSVSVTLDGRLDEPVWRDAPVLKLIQQSPKPGEPTRYETEVRIVVTTDRLYFGFICKDPDPSRIAAHTMWRDDTRVDFTCLLFTGAN